MANYSLESLPEVFATTTVDKAFVTAAFKSGRIRRIQRGIYTTNLDDSLEAVVRRNLWPLVALLAPSAVVSHRTALEGRPSVSGLVVVTGKYDRIVKLPGLQLRQIAGPGPLAGDAPFISGLYMSSRARFYLECLSGRVYGSNSLYMSSEAIEAHLETLLLLGEDKLNEVRDQARRISSKLKMEPAFQKLEAIIGALLGTRSTRLTSKTAIARAGGEPYDARRLELFQLLYEELSGWPNVSRPDAVMAGDAFQNIGFFDAYFSNFIEGTEFGVDEAIEIAFHNKIPPARPDDAHDVLGTYRIVGNSTAMRTRITDLQTKAFVDLLKAWHLTIMHGRRDKRPGQFKEVTNVAGNTLFVHPSLALGTLKRGFELARGLGTAFGRAVFLMFVVSEVHPFDDGNGRLARAILNAELVSSGERRIIVPTVFRVEYLDGLRALSRDMQPRTLVRMADQAQEFTAAIDFKDLMVAREQLSQWNAFDTSASSRLRRPT